ncbi:hypothetical protein D3C71_817070 [compost metagenome]
MEPLQRSVLDRKSHVTFSTQEQHQAQLLKQCQLTTWLSVMQFMVKRLMVDMSAEHV